MAELRVLVLCQNPRDDRIIPRMARALGTHLGWTVGAQCMPRVVWDVIYLSGYFEAERLRPWPHGGVGVAAYFTHREEEPPGNEKAKLFDQVAQEVDLRVVTCGMYARLLERTGTTVQAAAPLERERFTLTPQTLTPVPSPIRGRGGIAREGRPVVGLSGYTYANHRKGEDLVRGMLASDVGRRVEWRASGRGWPVTTVRYAWAEMPAFYQGVDVLVVPSRVEGIPMPPLEALACGKRVVVPRGVGLLDELPETPGIHRYKRGDLKSLLAALEEAAFPEEKVEPEALRAVTEPYSVEAWCEDHRRAFAEVFGGG